MCSSGNVLTRSFQNDKSMANAARNAQRLNNVCTTRAALTIPGNRARTGATIACPTNATSSAFSSFRKEPKASGISIQRTTPQNATLIATTSQFGRSPEKSHRRGGPLLICERNPRPKSIQPVSATAIKARMRVVTRCNGLDIRPFYTQREGWSRASHEAGIIGRSKRTVTRGSLVNTSESSVERSAETRPVVEMPCGADAGADGQGVLRFAQDDRVRRLRNLSRVLKGTPPEAKLHSTHVAN